MQLPRLGKSSRDEYSEGGGRHVLGNIRNRLGFSRDEEYDEFGDSDYGAYDEFEEYGEGYEEEFAEYGPNYRADDDDYDRAYRSYRDRGEGFPQLVTRDEVRASTQYPELHERKRGDTPQQPYRLRGVSPSEAQANYEAARSVRESSRLQDTAELTPLRSRRSEQTTASSFGASSSTNDERHTVSNTGLNSLFGDTDEAEVAPAQQTISMGRVHETPVLDSRTEPQDRRLREQRSGFDPYALYESGNTSAQHNPSRALSLIRPIRYEDVERVAKILKAGDVVVLILRETPDDLAKRVLDFSFGVASALEASVECPASKVFVITRFMPLSESEQRALKNKGVI